MPFSLPTQHAPFDRLACHGLAILYLVLTVFPVALPWRASLSDILLPFMAVALLWRYRRLADMKALLTGPLRWLFAFLALGLICTLLHGSPFVGEIYEWSVFVYMAVLFLFYRQLQWNERHLAWGGLVLLAMVMAAFVYAMAAPALHLPPAFCFTSPQMETTSMSLLQRRFAFTMGNPNLFGVFYPLPFAMMTPFVFGHDWRRHPLSRRLLLLPAMGAALLPLASSASKHGLLTLAILLSWLASLLSLPKTLARLLRTAPLLAIAAVFEITVLFVTFPLKREAPYLNTDCGMYRLHQSTYVRMLKATSTAWFWGMGVHAAETAYPAHVQQDVVKGTLEQYNAMASYTDFITFMDPHNEFLNQLVLFGLPAALLLLLFWLSLPNASPHPAAMACFVIALLCCCLWDDILSKRVIWVTAALLCPSRQSPS